MSIKYYHLAKDEELPDEFCAVRDIGGEPSEYTFYVPESENAKLRELVSWMYDRMDESCAVQYPYAPTPISYDRLMQAQARARELGVEVDA